MITKRKWKYEMYVTWVKTAERACGILLCAWLCPVTRPYECRDGNMLQSYLYKRYPCVTLLPPAFQRKGRSYQGKECKQAKQKLMLQFNQKKKIDASNFNKDVCIAHIRTY